MTRSMTRIAELETENERLEQEDDMCPDCTAIHGGPIEGCDTCKIFRFYKGGWFEEDECETCCLTECACLVCKCCETKRSHYKEVCGDCGKCNGIDKGSNDFNAKCCECDIPDETVFKCFECCVKIKRNSPEHDNCKTANGVDWYCEDCDIPDEDDEEDETVE